MARVGSQGDNVQPQKASSLQGDRPPINRSLNTTHPDLVVTKEVRQAAVIRGRVQNAGDVSKKGTIPETQTPGDVPYSIIAKQTDIVIPREVLEAPVGKIREVSPHLFRDFAVADVLDFSRLLVRFQGALQRGSAEDIYRSLQTLQGELAAVAKLEGIYQRQTGHTIDRALSSRLQGSQLEYARQLIGRGTMSSPYAIEKVPQTETDYGRVAQRLAAALNRAQPDMKAVYAALTPLRRNPALLYAVEKQSWNQFQINVRESIRERCTGQARDYALYLMGERNMETATLTAFEAGRLMKALSELSFVTNDQRREAVPFRYPGDGCYIRSYLMGQALTEMGYAVQNMYAVSMGLRKYEWQGTVYNLRVQTDYAHDAPSGQQAGVTWGYHVAPFVKVEPITHGGQPAFPVDLIIDPSLARHPQSLSEWLGKMGQTTFERISLGDYKDLYDHHGAYPTGQTFVFSTSRNITSLDLIKHYNKETLLNGDKYGMAISALEIHNTYSRENLTTFASLESHHETAYLLRTVIRQDVGKTFVAKITDMVRDPSPEAGQFLNLFPNLVGDVIGKLPPRQRDRTYRIFTSRLVSQETTN